MQTRNPFIDDLTKMANGAVGALTGVKGEVEARLRDQIARTHGDLTSENLLGTLAQQFGVATGMGHALRDAIGRLGTFLADYRERAGR